MEKNIIFRSDLSNNCFYQGKLEESLKLNLKLKLTYYSTIIDPTSNKYNCLKRVLDFNPNNNLEYYYKFKKFYKLNNFISQHHEVCYLFKLLDQNNFIFSNYNGISRYNKVSNNYEYLYNCEQTLRLDVFNEFVYSITLPNKLYIYNYDTNDLTYKYLEGFDNNKWLNFSKIINKDKILVGGNNNKNLKMINSNFDNIFSYETFIDSINNVDIFEENICTAVGDSKIISFIDFRIENPVKNLQGFSDINYSNTFLDKNYFVTGGSDGILYIWDIRKYEICKTINNFFNEISVLRYDDNNQKLFIVERNFTTSIIDLKNDNIQYIDYYINSAGVDFLEDKLYIGISDYNPGILELNLI